MCKTFLLTEKFHKYHLIIGLATIGLVVSEFSIFTFTDIYKGDKFLVVTLTIILWAFVTNIIRRYKIIGEIEIGTKAIVIRCGDSNERIYFADKKIDFINFEFYGVKGDQPFSALMFKGGWLHFNSGAENKIKLSFNGSVKEYNVLLSTRLEYKTLQRILQSIRDIGFKAYLIDRT